MQGWWAGIFLIESLTLVDEALVEVSAVMEEALVVAVVVAE